MTYLITWSCYGSRIPGEDVTVSRSNHLVGVRRNPTNALRGSASRAAMIAKEFALGVEQRNTVLSAILEVCRYRGWTLLAAHVRTAHVHVVVDAEITPERIMNALKSYSSRALDHQRMWARHGSTLYLWTSDAITNAVRYVVSKQGEPMAVYCVHTEP